VSDVLTIEPLAEPPDATVVVPGSKSITIRALLAAALAEGTSTLAGVLTSEDTDAMVGALRTLGFTVERRGTTASVTGAGGTVPSRGGHLDLVRSATSARLLLASVALGQGRYVIDGHPQLRGRPMGPGIDALRQLGLTVDELGEPGCLPVAVEGGPLRGGAVALPGDVSSQFVSGFLLAGPCTQAGVDVELTTDLVSEPYVAMTQAVMAAFGVPPVGLRAAPGRYVARLYDIEPDASSASYFFAAAAITGGRVRVEGLSRMSVQGDLGFVEVLASMGAEVTWGADAVEVRGTGRLSGVEVDMSQRSDTAPTLAAVAAFAETPTRATGIGFIRGKESDRIGAVVRELQRCGVDAVEEPDGFLVRPGHPHGARVETYDDHRMAMSFALLGLVVRGIEIVDPACVAKTFPGYWDVLDDLRRRPA
jgi:3-phosphoshikimate 1-carboxyvinyltransferase